jgi:hypothetical protein
MKKHQGKSKKQRARLKSASSAHVSPRSKNTWGELGVFERSYPPKKECEHAIESIRVVPENQRSPDQWWMLGEYLVYAGLLEESDTLTNEGIGALMRGANLPEPSIVSAICT